MKSAYPNIWVIIATVSFLNDVHSDEIDKLEDMCQQVGGISWTEYEEIPKIQDVTREMLWKVTQMEDYYDEERFGENADNFCSNFHFGRHCGPTEFIIIPFDQRVIGANALVLSYNEKTNTICRNFKKMEAPYRFSRDTVMASGYVMRVDRIDKNDMVTEVEHIPDFLPTDNEYTTTAVAYGGNGHWMMFRTCDGKHMWVKLKIPRMRTLQQHTEWEKKLVQFNEEIDKKLADLKIDGKTVTTVSLDLPFSPSTDVMPKRFTPFDPIPTPIAV